MQTTTAITPEIYAICLTYATLRCRARQCYSRYQYGPARELGYKASRIYANPDRTSWQALTMVKRAMEAQPDIMDPHVILAEAGIVQATAALALVEG